MSKIDIADRLRFDAARTEMQFSKGVAGNIGDAIIEIERLRVREAAALKLAESFQVEIERLTQERDLALANADAVYAKLMPEVEGLRAIRDAAIHEDGCIAHEAIREAVRTYQQQPNVEK